MLYPYEPRSTDYWDDDDGSPAEPMDLLDFLGALILFIPLTVICMIFILVGLAAQSLWEFVNPVIEDWRNGNRRSGLTLVVVCLAALLFAGWQIAARPEVEPPPARSLITPPTLGTVPALTPTRSARTTGLAGSPTGSGCARLATPGPPAWRYGYCADAAPTAVRRAVRQSIPVIATPTPAPRALRIVVDDFETEPIGDQPAYPYNRLGGDRGAINSAALTFGAGRVTTTVSAGNTWAGVWLSLNHPIREQVTINLDAVFPPQILPEYQSAIVGIAAKVASGTRGRTFRLELKDHGAFRWTGETVLTGGPQSVTFDLPRVGPANELVWVIDRALPGSFVALDSLTFTVTTRITDTATAAFVWSYGQLLDNWDPESGLVRDKAHEASREFDAVQATGSLAAATALAEQLGVVSRADAVQVVKLIGRALLDDLPRQHGLWPHWVRTSASGRPSIVPGTEYSSVDTVIAALGLLSAQSALGMDTSRTERVLREIDWSDLLQANGIRHGYNEAGELLPYAWDTFGGESWLVALAYAAATGKVAPLEYPDPPTANGCGFIDEMAWLYVPPPQGRDAWGDDWRAYRSVAAEAQAAYFVTRYPTSCLAPAGFFGLSAAEGPDPARVALSAIYQAFGVGGRFAGPNDGSSLWGAPVVVPHYAAMVASLRPQEATAMWDRLMRDGFFTPLTNVESIFVADEASCAPDAMTWNSLKGSWNLALQTLGWGRFLAQRRGEPPVLWRAVERNAFLGAGYALLAPDGPDLGRARGRAFLPVTLGGTRYGAVYAE
ncbi:MAG: hypothetical protein MUC34_13630 [Anaerolineae bacterium]|nr:hypothetical protein [Anaerolineae bacterium]